MKQTRKTPCKAPCQILVILAVLLHFANSHADTRANNVPVMDEKSREISRSYYFRYYFLQDSPSMNWTGNHSTCTPGEISGSYLDAVLLRINYYRAMAGVSPDIVFSDAKNQAAQEAALMMSANNALSHDPPAGWNCYTPEGAQAAGDSNLSWGKTGWEAIDGHMEESADTNASVCHRRFLLYPQTEIMGAGCIPKVGDYYPAFALVVQDENYFNPRPAPRDDFVAWPPPGFVPYPVVFDRWSLSHSDEDFSDAQVTMTENGEPIAVDQEAIIPGCGENTLVWRPRVSASDTPEEDTEYFVAVRKGGIIKYKYYVTVFDPNAVSLEDAVYAQKIAAGQMQETGHVGLDLTNDGLVDTKDGTCILQVISGLRDNPFENRINSISLSPPSPATIAVNQKVTVSYNYDVNFPEGTNIWAVPDSAAVYQSPTEVNTGTGSDSRFFYRTSAGTVSRIKLQAVSPDGRILYQKTLDVDYRYQ